MAALIPSHPELLAPGSRALASRLAARDWARESYLAGSAALTLYVGHRAVRDLDLMTGTNRLTGPERRDLLADLLSLAAETRVETARDGYLFVQVGEVGLRIFYYPYPLIEPISELDGLAVASAVDLGLMKIAAIISRGEKRDFVDLYRLCQHLPLSELLARSEDKFGHVRDFPLQALKGLADLSLTRNEPMPKLEQPLEWRSVETWVEDEVRRLGRAHVGFDAP